jgi:undecaprenyl diphosphate synthase
MSDLKGIDQAKVPQHVAIIMDGNGRWAEEKGQDRIFGHFNGVEAVRASLKAARKAGVKYLTLYAFSTENWNRPKQEVEELMDLLVQTIVQEVNDLDNNDVKFNAIGDIESLPESCVNELNTAIEKTKDNDGIELILALSYSSRWEIVRAIQNIIKDNITPDAVNEQLISDYLCTKSIPDPELVIRTSGEQRISNFLLWQIAYSELYFTAKYWPDFREEDFYEALRAFQQRQRRFGKTAEQINLTGNE